jgi:hypothetical protein
MGAIPDKMIANLQYYSASSGGIYVRHCHYCPRSQLIRFIDNVRSKLKKANEEAGYQVVLVFFTQVAT